MMHHTFNPDYLPPEGRGYIKSSNILVVDCLFYEDTGLLKCQKNDEAFEKITKWILGKASNEMATLKIYIGHIKDHRKVV